MTDNFQVVIDICPFSTRSIENINTVVLYLYKTGEPLAYFECNAFINDCNF